VATPSAAPSGTRGPDPVVGAGLAADFARLQSALKARVGLSIRAVGDGAPEATVLGDWQTGPAWSTIKIPSVIAALRRKQSPDISAAMTKAITESDNAAAESIWEGMGSPTQAAGLVQDLLGQNGDPTIVESQRIRPQYTAFGQTMWPLTDQTRFTAAAFCDPRNAQVLDLMGRIENDSAGASVPSPAPSSRAAGDPSRRGNTWCDSWASSRHRAERLPSALPPNRIRARSPTASRCSTESPSGSALTSPNWPSGHCST